MPDNYNNAAMESLMSDGDSSDPSSSLASASPSAPPTPPGLQIVKVPGGFQVSTIVPTIDEAHAISQRFLGPEQNGDGQDAQDQNAFSSPSDDAGQDDQPVGDADDEGQTPPSDDTDNESESAAPSRSAPPSRQGPPSRSTRKGTARQ